MIMTEESDDSCREIADGVFLCPDGVFVQNINEVSEEKETVKKEELGFVGEVAKAVYITTTPVITKSEASWLENNFAAVFLGSISLGLSTALGFYIYSLIGTGLLQIIPNPLWNALLIISFLIVGIGFLNFFQYRLTKALQSTKILERFAADEDGNGDGVVENYTY